MRSCFIIALLSKQFGKLRQFMFIERRLVDVKQCVTHCDKLWILRTFYFPSFQARKLQSGKKNGSFLIFDFLVKNAIWQNRFHWFNCNKVLQQKLEFCPNVHRNHCCCFKVIFKTKRIPRTNAVLWLLFSMFLHTKQDHQEKKYWKSSWTLMRKNENNLLYWPRKPQNFSTF